MKYERNIIIGIAVAIGVIGFSFILLNLLKILLILIPVASVVFGLIYGALKKENIRMYELRALQRIADDLSFFCSSEKELRKNVKIKVPISVKQQKDPHRYKVKYRGKLVKHTEEIDAILVELIESIDLEFMQVDLFFERLEDKINNFFDSLLN